jgi:hypothetical protein
MSDAGETFKSQTRFLELLDELTRSGRAEWVRSEDEPGFVHCLVDGEDLIEFECMGGEKGDQHVSPVVELAGAVAHHSNTTYLWLPLLPGWELLGKLLRSSRADDGRCRACASISYDAPVKALEERLKR